MARGRGTKRNGFLFQKAMGKNDGPRYSAVNLQHPGTVEIRMFRGTLNTRSFFKAIEVVHAAYEYTRAIRIADITVVGFRVWVRERMKDYPHLHAFLEDVHAVGVDDGPGDLIVPTPRKQRELKFPTTKLATA